MKNFAISFVLILAVALLIPMIVRWQAERFEGAESITIVEPSQAAESARKDEIVVNLRSNGDVIHNGSVVSKEDLLKRFRKLAQTYPNQAVILLGDKGVKWEHADFVVSNLKKAGIWNVAFAATKKSDNPDGN